MSICMKKNFIISIKLERFSDFYLISNFLNFVKIFLIVCNFYYVVNKISYYLVSMADILVFYINLAEENRMGKTLFFLLVCTVYMFNYLLRSFTQIRPDRRLNNCFTKKSDSFVLSVT